MAKVQKSASSGAYQLIKEKIIRNEFDPRQRLNEIDLAKEFNLSRTPVREALIMLEKDDLITRYGSNRGFYLRQYSVQDITHLYELREILEVSSVSRMIKNINDKHVEMLNAILSDVQNIINQERPADALVRALDFHIYCAQVCTNNPFIVNVLRNCYEKLIVISWTCHDLKACISSAHDHKKMLEAINERDVEKLVARTKRHIHNAQERMMDTLQSTKKLYFMP